MRVRADRDNQVNGYVELKQATGPSIPIGPDFTSGQPLVTYAEWPAAASVPDVQIQTGQVILDVPNNAIVQFPNGSTCGSLTLTVLESGRTPGTLPTGQFSPVIAQITPFGATITPGAKFTFPNPDGYAPNTQLKLYRFDQRATVNGQPNPTLGTFIESGTATVSSDGQRIESAANAVTETTYYFASGTRTTITLIGRVVENNLNRTPVRRSLVNARGQGIFTDSNGGFVIRNVPINAGSAAKWATTSGPEGGTINCFASLGGVLFAGTGATFFVAGAGIGGGGVYRSSDNGQSWTAVNNGLPGFALDVKALHSVGSNLFVGTHGGGVYRSSDNGQSWTAVNNGLLGEGTGPYVYVEALHSVEGNLYAGTEGGGVYRSSNNGQSWTAINNGLPDSARVKALHSAGSNLFVGTYSQGIYRSTDNGQSWTTINNGVPSYEIVLALHSVGGTLFAGTQGNGVYRPSDNGQSWAAANNGLPDFSTISAFYAIDNNLFAGVSGGSSAVYRSSDNGQSWVRFSSALTSSQVLSFTSDGTQLFAGSFGSGVHILSNNVQSWREINTNLSTKFINSVAINPTTIFAGTFGSGIFRSTDQGQSWMPANTNLPPDANIQSIITSGTTIWAASFGDGVYRSTNQGTSWTPVNAGLNNIAVNRLFLNGSTLYAGTEGGVYRSTNGGDNWTHISTGMGTVPVDSFAVLGGTVYAGTDGNGVYRLNGDGVSWTHKSSGLTSQQVRSLGVNGNLLYAGTIGGGICLSRNGGETWTAVNNQLPPTLNVYAFAVSGRKVYAGSISGVFFSEDDGQSWKQINAGLLNTYVTGLVVSGEQLFASTASGGVFISRIPQ